MNDWTPGPGWRPLGEHEVANGRDMIAFHPGDLDEAVLWVREAPVPPLPTEPYTVILVTYRNAIDKRAYVRNEASRWSAVPDGMGLPPSFAAECITGFVVLAEPRAVTADRIADWFALEAEFGSDDWRNRASSTIRREFGTHS